MGEPVHAAGRAAAKPRSEPGTTERRWVTWGGLVVERRDELGAFDSLGHVGD